MLIRPRNLLLLATIKLLFAGYLLWQAVPANTQGLPTLNVEEYYTPNPLGASATDCNHSRAVRRTVELIDNATENVYAALYHLICPTLENAIIRAHHRGLDVLIVTDTDNLGDSGFVRLISAGVEVRHGNEGSTSMHHKFVIVDKRALVTGTMNFTSTGTTCNANHTLIFPDDRHMANIFFGAFRNMAHNDEYGNDAPMLPPMISEYAGDKRITVLFSPHDNSAMVEDILRNARVYHLALFGLTLNSWADAIIENAYINEELGISGKEMTAVFDATGKGWTGSDFWQLKDVYGEDIAVEPATCKMHMKSVALEMNDGTKVVITGSANLTCNGTTCGNDENMLIIENAESIYDNFTTYVEDIFNALPEWTKSDDLPRGMGEMSPSACTDGRNNNYIDGIDGDDPACREVSYIDCHDRIDNDADGDIDLISKGCWYWLLFPYAPRAEDITASVDGEWWHILFPDYLQNTGGLSIAMSYDGEWGEPVPFSKDMAMPVPDEVLICAYNMWGKTCRSGDPTPQPNKGIIPPS